MGTIIPLRGAIHHAFGVNSAPPPLDVARLRPEWFRSLDALEGEAAAGPSILSPLTAARVSLDLTTAAHYVTPRGIA